MSSISWISSIYLAQSQTHRINIIQTDEGNGFTGVCPWGGGGGVRWQAGNTHPTGMLSCFNCDNVSKCITLDHISQIKCVSLRIIVIQN